MSPPRGGRTRAAGSSSGSRSPRSASLALFVGAVRRSGHPVRRARCARSCSSACSCSGRPSRGHCSDWIGWPAARLARHHGRARARERDAEPQAHVGDRGRPDDRRRAGRVHHDLRRVGEGVDRRPGRRGVQGRLRDQHAAPAFGAAFGGFSPQLATDIASCPQVGASSPLRINQAEFDGSNGFFAGIDPRSADRALQPEGRGGQDRRPRPAQQHLHLARGRR